MHIITATFRIVTPMFLGDSESTVLADTIRPPSFKGALRFWWRALQWGRLIDHYKTESAALGELKREEDKLFGSSDGGQSQVLITTSFQANTKVTVKDWPKNNTGSGYLGYGLFESSNRGESLPQRHAFHENQSFDIRLIFRANTPAVQVEQIKTALRCFGLVGGLGGRGQRRGFGSVAIEKLDDERVHHDTVQRYLAEVRRIFDDHAGTGDALPPFTAITKNYQLVAANEEKNAREAHAKLGQKYKDFRKQTGKPTGWKKIFGLPLAGYDPRHRRASPVFFHIHPVGNGSFCGAILLLPAVFHSEAYPNISSIKDYETVDSFLNPVGGTKP